MKVVIKYELDKDLNLHVIPDEKFKTVYISYCFHMDLDENYTYNALVPAVLKRGCEGYERQEEINKHLEGKYGSLFDVGVQKRGERQILRFTMDLVNEIYVGMDGLIAQSLYFLNRIISKPVTEGSIFKKDYVNQEKENLKHKIQAMVNDKLEYSMERCIQEMCKDEKYARYVFGSIKELDSLDQNKLYDIYRNMIAACPLDIFVAGDVDPEKISILVKNSMEIERTHRKIIPETIIKKIGVKQRELIEDMDISQAKLNIGLRTNTSVNDKGYFPLVLYTSILGGGPHSKLFMNVREKHSLAYYAFAKMDKYKGILILGSGLDTNNYRQALDIIMQQCKDISMGKITEAEFTASINAIMTSVRGINDDPEGLVDYYLGNVVTGAKYSLEDFIEEIQKVKPENVVEVSKHIKTDLIYLLKPEEAVI
ncbi:MAG: insulinase family protein [Clostridiales bacterium]|nr:insulinase family protein [Clostridiales bacterium]